MTIEEILKAQGIEDSQVKSILAAMKENKVYTAGEENLDVRYSKLKDEHTGKLAELEKANGLIAELQKSTKGNEQLQSKISQYETEIGELQEQLKKTQVDAAIKVALLSEHALDVDYLTFKLTEGGEIELDENGNIKGWDDKIAGLKTKFPTQFETANTEKKIEENKLEKGEQNRGGVTKSDILKMPYNERMKLYTENKEAYEQAMHS